MDAVDAVGAAANGVGALASMPPPEPRALCVRVAEVEGAIARGQVAALRERYAGELRGPPSAARSGAVFATRLLLDSPAARLRAFDEDARAHPDGVLGPMGACWVAADAIARDAFKDRCEVARARAPDAALVEAALARAWRRRGAFHEALAAAQRALVVDPSCPIALMERATLLDTLGDVEGALAAWLRARASQASCAVCTFEAARLVEELRGPAAALVHWEEVLRLEPASVEALRRVGAALASTDPARALASYESAIAAGDRTPQTHLAAAELASARGDVRKALTLAEGAVRVQPAHVDAWRLVLAWALQTGEETRAHAAATELLRLADGDVAALWALARSARARHDLVQAVAHYAAARRALAAGQAQGQGQRLPPRDIEALQREHRRLLDELKVKGPPARGTAAQVVSSTKVSAERMFADRLKSLPRSQKAGFRGTLELAVTVAQTGAVDDVDIIRDTLNDPVVVASVVAHLRRATISGGPQRYVFQMDFQ